MARKPVKSILLHPVVYEALDELREYSGLPIVQLVTLLFESNGLIKRNTISNFFEDHATPHGKRRFKEWKMKKLKMEKEDGNNTTDD